MAFPPQAFILGAQKAGTTTLADLLAQHPKIVLSEPKEPDFFHVNWARGLGWYRSRFSRTDGVLLDASVGYTMAPDGEWRAGRELDVPRRLRQTSPDAKFIYLVRDPAERCYSAYWHEMRARGETRSLRQAVEQKAYYTMASYYHRQISRFLPFFPCENFLFVNFSRLVHDPAGVARQCALFLGAGEFAFQAERGKNRGFRYNRVGEALRGVIGRGGLTRLMPDAARVLGKRLLTREIPRLDPADRAWLHAHFREDAEAFAALTGVQVIAPGSAACALVKAAIPVTIASMVALNGIHTIPVRLAGMCLFG